MSTVKSAIKYLFVLAQLEASSYIRKSWSKSSQAWSKIHFADCAALAAVLFTILIENLRLCSSTEAGLFLICS